MAISSSARSIAILAATASLSFFPDCLATVRGDGPRSERPAEPDAGPVVTPDDAVAVEALPLRQSPSTHARLVGRLRSAERVTVLERTATRSACVDSGCDEVAHEPEEFIPEGEGSPWFRVRREGGEVGWVYGRSLAVHASSQHLPEADELAGPVPPSPEVDLDGDGDDDRVWLAVTDHAWAGTNFLQYDSTLHLVVEPSSSGVVVVAHVGGLDMGAGEKLRRVSAFDVSGDGRPELMVETVVTEPEVGWGGYRIRALSLDGEVLREVFRQDAPLSILNGLDVSPSLGEIAIDRRKATSRTIVVKMGTACPVDGLAWPDRFGCLTEAAQRFEWSEDDGRLVPRGEPSRAKLRAGITGAERPLRATPSLEAEVVDQIERGTPLTAHAVSDWVWTDEIDGRRTHWIAVTSEGGVAGWIPAIWLDFADDRFEAFMHGEWTDRHREDLIRW